VHRGIRNHVNLCGRPASFRPDVGSLDDRPPFLDFGLVEGAERFPRLLVALDPRAPFPGRLIGSAPKVAAAFLSTHIVHVTFRAFVK
jgi:hypothetical protein